MENNSKYESWENSEKNQTLRLYFLNSEVCGGSNGDIIYSLVL